MKSLSHLKAAVERLLGIRKVTQTRMPFAHKWTPMDPMDMRRPFGPSRSFPKVAERHCYGRIVVLPLVEAIHHDRLFHQVDRKIFWIAIIIYNDLSTTNVSSGAGRIQYRILIPYA